MSNIEIKPPMRMPLADEVNCLKNLKRKYYARKTV